MTDPTGILERLMAYRMGLGNDEPELMDLLRDVETMILRLEKERDESEIAHINLGIAKSALWRLWRVMQK